MTSTRAVIDAPAAVRLATDEAGGETLWLDADRPDQPEIEAIARLGHVPLDTLRQVLDSDRPAMQVSRRTLVALVATAVEIGGRLHLVRTAVVVAPSVVVTCHPDRPRVPVDRCAAAAARLTADAADTPHRAVAVLLDELIDDQWALGDDIDDRLADAAAEAVGGPPPTADHIAALRRDLLALHRVIGPLRRQLADLVDATADARDEDRLEQLHTAVVALRAQVDTQLLLLGGLSQTQLLTASQHANAVMQATSSWGAILVVATLITGVYGMNFRVMPELTWSWGYPFAIGLMVVTTVLLHRLFRARGWL